jgi:hypothetical protein
VNLSPNKLRTNKDYVKEMQMLDVGLTTNEYWTDGVVTRNIDPCLGNFTINWCSVSQNMSSSWWNGKFQAITDTDLEKQVTLKVDPASENSTLGFSNATLELPFMCKV